MLTQDEAELYDRQIRLWGVNAQSKIRQSKVLMLGFNGIASEVAKILVLAGIDTLTIVDDKPLQESDITSNLFCRPNGDDEKFRTHAVKTKLKTLNPLVKVNIDNTLILDKKPEDFKDYDLVTLHSFLTIDETIRINDICRENKIKFYIVIDFGFYGFMFNDLGSEFKFTYENFNAITDQGEEVKQSGAEKDPISFGDEVAEEDPDDVGYGASDDEEDRPKKKRRVHSPGDKNHSKVENEKSTKVGSLPYARFIDMISLKNANFTKQTSPVLLISVAMYRFYSKYEHLPRCENRAVMEEDASRLNDILNSLRETSNPDEKVFQKLDENWPEHIYGSLSPVCAVLGGVAGQDMIRALSNKDIPLNNTFAFDGISMSGIVEKVGIEDKKVSLAQPIVRDMLQIDDDD